VRLVVRALIDHGLRLIDLHPEILASSSAADRSVRLVASSGPGGSLVPICVLRSCPVELR
jgi:hypothetical protein